MRTIGIAALILVGFVVAVNVIWFVAPLVGSPGVYRPLFGILLVVVASAVWRQVRGES
jgi:hypothetical protein